MVLLTDVNALLDTTGQGVNKLREVSVVMDGHGIQR